MSVFLIALLLIYMILAALFRSYIQPVIVITSIPVGFAGIIFGVGLMGYDISFNLIVTRWWGSRVSSMNDALVMVDFHQPRQRQWPPRARRRSVRPALNDFDPSSSPRSRP